MSGVEKIYSGYFVVCEEHGQCCMPFYDAMEPFLAAHRGCSLKSLPQNDCNEYALVILDNEDTDGAGRFVRVSEMQGALIKEVLKRPVELPVNGAAEWLVANMQTKHTADDPYAIEVAAGILERLDYDELTELERNSWSLIADHEYTHQETADELGCSRQNVSRAYSAARKKLLAQLGNVAMLPNCS